jgi:hypothetical protein
MSEHRVEEGEMDEVEEVLDVVFPVGYKGAEVVHPGDESIHFPSPVIATQLTSILGSPYDPTPID